MHIHIALAKDRIGAFLDAAVGAFRRAIAGDRYVAIHKPNIVQQNDPANLVRGPGLDLALRGFIAQIEIFDEIGFRYLDLGIPHHHLIETVAQVTRFTPAGAGKGIAALGEGANIEGQAQPGAHQIIGAVQLFVFEPLPVKRQQSVQRPYFYPGFPPFEITGLKGVFKALITGENPRFEIRCQDG